MQSVLNFFCRRGRQDEQGNQDQCVVEVDAQNAANDIQSALEKFDVPEFGGENRLLSFSFQDLLGVPNLYDLRCKANILLQNGEACIMFRLQNEKHRLFKGQLIAQADGASLLVSFLRVRTDDHEFYSDYGGVGQEATSLAESFHFCIQFLCQFQVRLAKIEVEHDAFLHEYAVVAKSLAKAIRQHKMKVLMLKILLPMIPEFVNLVNAAYEQGCRWFQLRCAQLRPDENEILEFGLNWITDSHLAGEIFSGTDAQDKFTKAHEGMQNFNQPFGENVVQNLKSNYKGIFVKLSLLADDFPEVPFRKYYLVPSALE